jgi:hypothetical protein
MICINQRVVNDREVLLWAGHLEVRCITSKSTLLMKFCNTTIVEGKILHTLIDDSSFHLWLFGNFGSDCLFENGTPQKVSSSNGWCCWKQEHIGAFRMVHHRMFLSNFESAQSFDVWEWKTPWVANFVWVCATFGIQCPNLFWLLETSSNWLFESFSIRLVLKIGIIFRRRLWRVETWAEN